MTAKKKWYCFYKIGRYSFSFSRNKDIGLIWEFCPWILEWTDWVEFRIGGFILFSYYPGYLTILGLSFFKGDYGL